MKADGQPKRLTLRHIATEKMSFTASTVFVCENPVVVAEAADVLGVSAPPIVCTEGIPNTAALLLLAHVRKDVALKKKLPALGELRLESFAEGSGA